MDVNYITVIPLTQKKDRRRKCISNSCSLVNMASNSEEQDVPTKPSIDERRPSANLDFELRDLALRATASLPSAQGRWHQVLYPKSDSSLDPRSPTFDGRSWVKAFVDLYNSNLPTRPRSLGVAFRNLTVYGDTSGARHQTSAGNILLSDIQSVARRLGGVRQSKQVTILKDFEGVLDEGQLLLVLGPPGSGCSTLLKTIAGETAGLRESPETSWNYRGARVHRQSRRSIQIPMNADCPRDRQELHTISVPRRRSLQWRDRHPSGSSHRPRDSSFRSIDTANKELAPGFLVRTRR